MCTVTLLRRPDSPWPLLIAANRDEMRDRSWLPPARHWADRPDVIGGIDTLAGGSWLAMNDHGVVATILNRHGTLGPQPGKRTRGELVLDALDHADASEAASMLADLDGRAYRPFNMVIADNRDAYWLRHSGREDGRLQVSPLAEGLFMLTAFDMNDRQSDPRIDRYLPAFTDLPAPDGPTISADLWTPWEQMLTGATPVRGSEGTDTTDRHRLCFMTTSGFGTTSSALLALPGIDTAGSVAPIWRFSPDPQNGAPFTEIPTRTSAAGARPAIH